MWERWQVDFVDQNAKRRHKQFERKKDADAYLVEIRPRLSPGPTLQKGHRRPSSKLQMHGSARASRTPRALNPRAAQAPHRPYRRGDRPATRLARISVTQLETLRELLARHSRPTARHVGPVLVGRPQELFLCRRPIRRSALWIVESPARTPKRRCSSVWSSASGMSGVADRPRAARGAAGGARRSGPVRRCRSPAPAASA